VSQLLVHPGELEHGDRRRARATIVALWIAVLGFSFQQTAPIPVFPTIERQLHASATWTTWLLSGYLIVAAVSAPLFGKLGDRHGRRRMLLCALGVYLVGSLGAAASPDIWALIAFRALQGVGGSVFPLALAIARDELGDDQIGRGIGALTGAFGVGAILSFGLSGLLTSAVSWRLVFIAGAVTVAISLLAVARFVPVSESRTQHALDLPGVLLLGGALASLIIAITIAPTSGWVGVQTGIAALAFVLLAAAWGWRELATDEPLLDLRILGSREILCTNVATFAAGFCVFAIYVLVPHLVQAPSHLPAAVARRVHYGFGAGVVETGLLLVPQAIGLTLAGPPAGIIARARSGRIPLGGGLCLIALASGWLALRHGSRLDIVGALLVVGLGWGSVIGSAGTVVTGAVDAEDTAVATGLNSDVRLVGGGVGGQMAAALMTAIAFTPQAPRESAFVVGFALAGAVALLGAAFGLAVGSGDHG
jgi:hypothetical protein